jgi:uncharacterized protein YjiK
MISERYWAALAVCLILASACQPANDELPALIGSSTAVARETRLQRGLADHDTAVAGAPLAQWLLPPALQEISGLALTRDSRLLVHDDEVGQVWEIDFRRGILVKLFALGSRVVKGDFESIAIANDVVFLLASNGTLYEFPEGASGAQVEYKVHDTGLKKACEFEGVAFAPAINALLLACKTAYAPENRGQLVIYRWSLTGDTAARLTRLSVPLAGVIGSNGWKGLHPTDITVDPVSHNYVLVASQEKALVEITPAGVVVFARPLPAMHHQPEGIAITKDSILIVSDEAGQRPAMITLYRWPE